MMANFAAFMKTFPQKSQSNFSPLLIFSLISGTALFGLGEVDYKFTAHEACYVELKNLQKF